MNPVWPAAQLCSVHEGERPRWSFDCKPASLLDLS